MARNADLGVSVGELLDNWNQPAIPGWSVYVSPAGERASVFSTEQAEAALGFSAEW